MAKRYKVTKVLMNAQPEEDNQGWVEVSSTVYASNIRDTYEELVFIVDRSDRQQFKIGDMFTIPDNDLQIEKEDE